jgi:hypothetical protein
MKRIIAGGLLAGLVLNIGEAVLHGYLLADQTASAMTTLGLNTSGTPIGLTLLVLVTFLQGVTGVWLHVATRVPSVMIGLALWFLSAAYSATYIYAGFPGVMPDAVVWWPVAWELVQYPLAIWIGGLVARESQH